MLFIDQYDTVYSLQRDTIRLFLDWVISATSAYTFLKSNKARALLFSKTPKTCSTFYIRPTPVAFLWWFGVTVSPAPMGGCRKLETASRAILHERCTLVKFSHLLDINDTWSNSLSERYPRFRGYDGRLTIFAEGIRPVVHDGTIIVRSTKWINGIVFSKIVFLSWNDVIFHDFHIIVAIRAWLFVVKPKCMTELVRSNPYRVTSRSKGNLLWSPCSSKVWPATSFYDEVQIGSLIRPLYKLNASRLRPHSHGFLGHPNGLSIPGKLWWERVRYNAIRPQRFCPWSSGIGAKSQVSFHQKLVFNVLIFIRVMKIRKCSCHQTEKHNNLHRLTKCFIEIAQSLDLS